MIIATGTMTKEKSPGSKVVISPSFPASRGRERVRHIGRTGMTDLASTATFRRRRSKHAKIRFMQCANLTARLLQGAARIIMIMARMLLGFPVAMIERLTHVFCNLWEIWDMESGNATRKVERLHLIRAPKIDDKSRDNDDLNPEREKHASEEMSLRENM